MKIWEKYDKSVLLILINFDEINIIKYYFYIKTVKTTEIRTKREAARQKKCVH